MFLSETTINTTNLSHRLLWRKWTISCALGELIGISVAAIVAGVLITTIGEPVTTVERGLTLSAMVGGGLIEGCAIGYFQWRVLRHIFPDIQARAWVGMTLAVAALGWFLGMLPSTIFVAADTGTAPFDPSIAMTMALAAFTGLGAGVVFGIAQWLILRKHAHRAGLWIVGNALGWALALMWIYVAAALPTIESSTLAVAGFGITAGILAGLSVGAVTGWFLIPIVVASFGKEHNTA